MKMILFPLALLLGTLSFPPGSQAQDHARWGLPEGAVLRLGKGRTGEGDRAVAYSPDGTRLAVAGNLGVWLYDVHTGAELALLTGHAALVHSVVFCTGWKDPRQCECRPYGEVVGRRRGTVKGHP